MPRELKPARIVLPDNRPLFLDRPLVMGILNATPDSFFDGDTKRDLQKDVQKGLHYLNTGADILDIGGESTRPGATPVSEEEERRRVIPLIQAILREKKDALISIDTMKVRVAKEALTVGASIINDVSAGDFSNDAMIELAVKMKSPIILMHKKGDPVSMQNDPQYLEVVKEVRNYLKSKADSFYSLGGSDNKIIVDPGIGFGKNLKHNLSLLKNISHLGDLGYPVLIGASRKKLVGELTGREPTERLGGSIGVHLAAIENGASIVRVHDPMAMSDSIHTYQKVRNMNPSKDRWQNK